MSVQQDNVLETFGDVSNDGAETISFEEPYTIHVEISGASPMLFHRWSVDDVEAKAKAAKGSKAKKTDNVESYVWRNRKNEICLPGEYLRMSAINASKFLQDPRSPRKSAMDLFRAGLIVLTDLASLGSKDWDYLDRRRVTVQRQGITRIRPAFDTGWKAAFEMQVLIPEYISKQLLHETISKAGRLVGVADFRPTFGRYMITAFDPAS